MTDERLEPVLADLGEQGGARDAQQEGRLAAIAVAVREHRRDVARLRRLERFWRWLGGPLGHHKVRDDRIVRRHGVADGMGDQVPGSTQRLDERRDIVALGVGRQQTQMEGTHAAKLAPEIRSGHAQVGEPPSAGIGWTPTLPLSPDSFLQGHAMLDIPSLSAGDEIHHPLLVLDVVRKGGDHPRTVVVFGNRTGRIDSAPFWAGRDEIIKELTKGMIAQVVGTVTAYRDALQVETGSVRALPKGSIELADFVPSVGPVEKYWQYLDEVRHKLRAPRLRAVVDLFFADEAFRERFERCPGAPGVGHHALLGGLLQHVSEVVSIGRQMARVARADEELVAVAAMLHDIGKLESYTWEEGIFDTTERGRLAGHVVIGAMMFREALLRAETPPCTDEEAMVIEHLILSHHGRLEYGAPVRPMTLEAEILSMADDASAKTASITESYAAPEYFVGDARLSSRRVWQLDNRWLFRLAPDFGRSADDRKDEAADQQG